MKLTLVTLFSITPNDKITEGIAKGKKKKRDSLSEVSCKPDTLIQTVVHRPNLYYSKIYKKRISISSGTGKKYDLLDT